MENIEAMLCAFIEGDLDEAGRAEIEKHLQEHPEHRKLLAELMATRDLVRELPRVKAPMDVSESLHGHVERSILLDGAQGAPGARRRGMRWTSALAIAAVFLLSVALCFIVYRVLVPTSSQPAFTEVASSATPQSTDQPTAAQRQELLDEDLATAKPQAPPSQSAQAEAGKVDVSKDAELDKKLINAGTAQSNQFPVFANQQNVEVRPMTQSQVATFDDVRNSVKNSGYDVGGLSAGSPQPLVLVINTPNPPQTNSTVTRFLNSAGSNVSWSKLPGGQALSQVPATQPGDRTVYAMQNSVSRGAKTLAGVRSAATEPTTGPSDQVTAEASPPAAVENSMNGQNAPTTQPASDLYVVKGMTRQQAELLRKSFAADDRAEIYEPTAGVAAPSTEPSGNVGQSLFDQAKRDKATEPTSQPDVLGSAGPTTATSSAAGAGGAEAAAKELTVNAVIVVQPAQPAAAPAATQPDIHIESTTTRP